MLLFILRYLYDWYLSLLYYDYAEYPLETGILVGKHLENKKIVVESDVLPKIKGNLSQTIVFKEQSNAYYRADLKSIQFDKLPHF